MFAVFPLGYVFAQSSFGLQVSPPNTEATLDQGQSVEHILQLTNLSDKTLEVLLSIANFTAADDESGRGDFSPDTSVGLASWILISPNKLTLAAGATGNVRYTITAPKDASPGGHYATIFARTNVPGSNTGGSGSEVGAIVGANILVNISGEVVEKAQIAGFSIPKARYDVDQELEFVARVINQGNTHIKPMGVIEIFKDGKKVKDVPLNPYGGNVLPDSTRKYAVKAGSLPSGTYTAQLALAYGATKQTLTASPISFVVVGANTIYYIMGAIAALLAVIGYLVWNLRRQKQFPKGLDDVAPLPRGKS